MKKNELGITLMEIMIAIALIGVLFTAIYMTYFSVSNVFSFNNRQVVFHRDQRLIKETIDSYVRSAEIINIDNGINSNNGIDITESYINIITTNGTSIAFGSNEDNKFIYDLDPENLGGEKILTNNRVESLIFSESGGVLNIQMTLSDDKSDYTFEEKFHPRISGFEINP